VERQLIEKIKQGDEKAFEQVYNKYYEQLCRFSLHLIHNSSLVEEVVDDVLFYLWDNREEIDITSLDGYLLRAVKNRSLNAVNSLSYRKESKNIGLDVSEEANFLNSLFDDKHPLEKLLEQEMKEELTKAINNLPEECRRVFKLSRMENKKYSEIALMLGISVNTVKYHMSNAISILSKNMVPYVLIFILSQNN
jgi:RNA polymerase sigma-70 factor (ECF subfamily)